MSSTLVSLPEQPITPRKPRKSIKPPHVKAQVIAKRYLENKQISQIAKDTGMSRPTVYAILDEANLDEQLEVSKKLSVGLVPRAIAVMEHRLSQNSENAAIKTLENTIWPLSDKRKGANLAGMQLTVAIQNLLGTTTNSGSGLEKTPVNEANSQVIDNPPPSKD